MGMRRDIWRGPGLGPGTSFPVKRLPPGAFPTGAEGGSGTAARAVAGERGARAAWTVTGDGVVTRPQPPGAGGVATWPVADAERWRRAGGPAILAPSAVGGLLGVLVVTAYVLLYGVADTPSPVWHGGPGEGAPGEGTDWRRYPGAVLLAALPLWYRYVPVAVVPAALCVAVETGVPAARNAGTGDAATVGQAVVLAACGLAFAGGCLRLRARRRQRALALKVAGKQRFPLPEGVPESDGHRGHRRIYLGLALALIASGILTEGLVRDLSAGGTPYDAVGVPYDAVGQQRVALVLLVAATTFYGRGRLALRAARRLYEEAQPALIVGVRAGPDGRHWVYPDARTTAAAPLIAYVPRRRDTRTRTRLLGGGSAYGYHDVDPEQEPFEAVLYGTVAEGDEAVLVHADVEYHRHQETGRMYATVTTAPLRPDRFHRLGPWEAADGPTRQRERLRRAREQEERLREASREAARRAAERARNPPRPAAAGSSGDDDRSARHSCGGCGSSCGGCGGD